MAMSVNPVSAGTTSDPNQASSVSALGNGVSKDTFLQLLVAQIKNQDPLSPADSTQFVAQLAQFSELEQVIGIRGDISALRQDVETPLPAPAPTTPATAAAAQI